MELLTTDDVNAINRLLGYAAEARAEGRRCDVEMHFNSDERAVALKMDLGAPNACYAIAYEPGIPAAVDRVLAQAHDAGSDPAPKTDPAPAPALEECPW